MDLLICLRPQWLLLFYFCCFETLPNVELNLIIQPQAYSTWNLKIQQVIKSLSCKLFNLFELQSKIYFKIYFIALRYYINDCSQ
uniref:Secreted protein n=1 Tax=Tetranychus urticae TaxID=32264 RepID=T1KTK0_TETUR